MQRPLASQSPNRVGSGPFGPPRSAGGWPSDEMVADASALASSADLLCEVFFAVLSVSVMASASMIIVTNFGAIISLSIILHKLENRQAAAAMVYCTA